MSNQGHKCNIIGNWTYTIVEQINEYIVVVQGKKVIHNKKN